MNLAKISCNGQITVPLEIRRAMQLKSGDKIVFLYNNKGEITIHSLNTVTNTTQPISNVFPIKALAQA